MNQVLRVFPAAGNAGEASLWTGGSKALEDLQFFRADESGDCLAVPGDHNGITSFGVSDVFTEFSLHLGDRSIFGHGDPPVITVKMTIMTKTYEIKRWGRDPVGLSSS
jgi:hypothetical protein